jgi:hypothetical protein
LFWHRQRNSPKYWSDGEKATLPNVGVMETSFLNVGVVWREYRSKTPWFLV